MESLLLLLEQLDQYLAFLDSVSGLAAETAHRVVELIKVLHITFSCNAEAAACGTTIVQVVFRDHNEP